MGKKGKGKKKKAVEPIPGVDITHACCNRALCNCVWVTMCHKTATSDCTFEFRLPDYSTVSDLFDKLYQVAGCDPTRPYVPVATFPSSTQTTLVESLDGELRLVDDLGMRKTGTSLIFFGTTERDIVQVRRRCRWTCVRQVA